MIRFRPCKRWPLIPGVPGVILAGWSIAVLLLAIISYPVGNEVSLCHIRTLTGFPCATCGGTRATASLLQGNLAQALQFNPLVTCGLIAGGLVLCLRFIAGRQVGLQFNRRGWLVITTLLLVTVGINWAYVAWFHWTL